ncbi:MAG: ClpXP protease specificity-enhancing factor [Alistipes senegalensis]|nr:ClpXP protease specificity-enhancing factor [Oxalobacter formigenes]MCM1281638.1 ClpXP protease specificity-enhancing factor [Alistipes senegalensis]
MENATKPYLVRAIHEWCTDNGFTPYIAVDVDASTRLPMQFVREGQIVLDISYEATSGLVIDNETIRFKARFAGSPHDISIPVNNVMAIYAKQNGHGMAFDVKRKKAGEPTPPKDDPAPPKKNTPPTFTRVK